MPKNKRTMYLKELELLDFIDQQGCPDTALVTAKAKGTREYDNYFGENGALVRQTIMIPHPITGVKEPEVYQMVGTWWEGKTKLHRINDQGQRYRKALRELIYSWIPYSEAAEAN